MHGSYNSYNAPQNQDTLLMQTLSSAILYLNGAQIWRNYNNTCSTTKKHVTGTKLYHCSLAQMSTVMLQAKKDTGKVIIINRLLRQQCQHF